MYRICQQTDFPICLATALACLVSGFALLPVAFGQGDEQRLAEYLNFSGLEKLSLVHAENRYACETDSERRRSFAVQLVKRYRSLMLNPADRGQISELIRKVQNLLIDFPQLESPQLQIAVSHANFLARENEFFKWWQLGASPANATELVAEFKRLKKEVSRQRRHLSELQDELIALLPLTTDDALAEQKKLSEVEGRIAHLDFLSGWTCYFLAVIPVEVDQSLLNQGHQHFYDSLQIEQSNPIDKIDSKWIELDSLFARKTILGLGLIYAAQSQHASSQFCMGRLKSLDPGFESSLWTLHSIAFARKWGLLAELQPTTDMDHMSLEESRRYYRALTFAGIVAKAGIGDSSGQLETVRLQRAGFMGLLRRFDFDSILEITKQNHFVLDQRNAEDLWIEGIKKLKQAESKSELFSQAGASFKKALAIESSQLDRTDRLRIKYLAAVAEFGSQNVESALAFLSPTVIESDDDLLAEAAGWLRARILIQQSRVQGGKTAAALAALNKVDSRFPQSKLSNRIRFEKLLLESRLITPERAVKLLEGIDREDEYYPQAIFEIAANRFRLWQLEFQDSSPEESLCFENLQNAVRKVIDESRADVERKASALFYLVEASLQRKDSLQLAADILRQYDSIVSRDEPVDSATIFTYRFYKFRLARLAGELKSADRIGQLLVAQSTDYRHRIVCLGYLAQRLETQNKSVPEKISLYEKLVEELGINPAILQSSRNSRVAANRLVELLIESNQFEKAEPINAALITSAPNRLPFLMNNAKIASGVGRVDLALQRWRKIAKGSQAGDPFWIEAKYSIAKIHAVSSVELAHQIVQQTLAITGDLPPEWQVKFDELSQQLRSQLD